MNRIRTLKYVIVEDRGLEQPILLSPKCSQHKLVESCGDKIISAGFVTFHENGKVDCHGCSVSLHKESRPVEDSMLIKVLFTGNEAL